MALFGGGGILIIPAFCGPLGVLFPIRLRARVWCRVNSGKASLDAVNMALGTQYGSVDAAVAGMSPTDALKVLNAIGW